MMSLTMVLEFIYASHNLMLDLTIMLIYSNGHPIVITGSNGNPETGGLKGMFCQISSSSNYYVYNVRGTSSGTSGTYTTSDVFSGSVFTDGTITLRKNVKLNGTTVDSNGSFTGDWRVVVNHAGEGSTLDFTSLEIKENVPIWS